MNTHPRSLSTPRTRRAAALSVALLAACSASAGTQPDAPGTSRPIKVGEELVPISQGPLGVSLIEVRNDSRCPASVQCVRAGSADVVFGVRMGRGPTVPTTLRVGDQEPKSTVTGGVRITLDSLTPYPATPTTTISQAQYTAWITFNAVPN